MFLEPLADALEHEGHAVLKARTASEALRILEFERVNLVTVDIMIDPGSMKTAPGEANYAGMFLCREIRKRYPTLDAFCISVISDRRMIKEIESLSIKFIRKGETPLRKVINMIKSRISGIAFEKEFG